MRIINRIKSLKKGKTAPQIIAKFVVYESGYEWFDSFGIFVVFCTIFVLQIMQTIDN